MGATQWYVFTGGPCSGKSTMLAEFEKNGFRVVPESAGAVIAEAIAAGKTINEARADEIAFQYSVMERQMNCERDLPPDALLLLDRALPDSAAYHAYLGLNPDEIMVHCKRNLYKKIFLMELLPFQRGDARTEDARAAENIHQHIKETYQRLGYTIISVPAMPIEQRFLFVRSRL